MIAPVSDIRPGVTRIRDFPIDTLLADPVGVVAIRRGGIQEGADHAFDKFRIRPGQRFPVLEDIPPVAFIIQLSGTIGVLDVDRKTIPGTAGIAMPAAEGQR